MPINELSNVVVEAISIVTKGANRKQFFLRKSADEIDVDELIDLPAHDELIKTSDWSTVYCVVAEPGWLEEAGQVGDASVFDRWASEDEIRKAAHAFMKNGALVNRMHETLDPFGSLVENAIALEDFTVNGHTIRKGSWYVAIEPTAEGKEAIEKGEFTGISIQGTGVRQLVEKAAEEEGDGPHEALWQRLEKAEAFTKPGTANISAADRKKLMPLVRHYRGKPHFFRTCVRDQMKHGLSREHANRRCAVLKDLALGSTKWRGKVKKNAASGFLGGSLDEVERSFLKKLGTAVGLSADDMAELDEIEKGAQTFGQIYAQRELDQELPDAMDALRSVIWRAYYPNPDDEDTDPREVIATSLDEFKAWALELLDRVTAVKKGSPEADELRARIEKSFASGGESDTVEDVELNERVEKIEKAVEALPDQIAEAVAKATKPEADDAPTAESVQKAVDELRDEFSTKLDEIGSNLKKLGAGSSSQGGGGRKRDPEPDPEPDRERLAKIDSGEVPAAGIL